MAQNVNPTFVKTPNVTTTQFTTGVGITQALTTIYTGGANGSKVVGITVTNATSATQDVRVAINSSGSIVAYVNTVSAITLSGFNSLAVPTTILSSAYHPVDSDGNPYIFLASSATLLQANVTTNSSQWASGNFFAFMVNAGDF